MQNKKDPIMKLKIHYQNEINSNIKAQLIHEQFTPIFDKLHMKKLTLKGMCNELDIKINEYGKTTLGIEESKEFITFVDIFYTEQLV